jgi:hypothetical protein
MPGKFHALSLVYLFVDSIPSLDFPIWLAGNHLHFHIEIDIDFSFPPFSGIIRFVPDWLAHHVIEINVAFWFALTIPLHRKASAIESAP